jgi:putative transposase
MTVRTKKARVKETLKMLRGNSSRERLLHRLHSVALVLRGYSASEAARIYGDSARAVAYWVTRFNRHGIEGLEEEMGRGRPSRLNAAQWKNVQAFVNKAAVKSKRVNGDTLSSFLMEQFGIALTPRQCWRILKRLRT